MSFLYGDSTLAPFTSNVLELLRDALDFSIFVLQADQQIALGRARMAAIAEQANGDLGHLGGFFGHVVGSIDAADKGRAEAPTARCAAQLRGAILEMHRAWEGALRADMDAAIAHLQAEEAALRAECTRALGVLLLAHDPPETRASTSVVLRARGYEARRAGRAPFGLDWTLELRAPDAWSGGVRVDRFVTDLEIRAPQTTGWLSKEVKIRPQALARYVLTELACDGETTSFELRAEPDAEAGFDVTCAPAGVSAARVGPADDAAVGPFEVQAEDAKALRRFAQKLEQSASELARHGFVAATFDEAEFETLPAFAPVVERLVAMLAPIVAEIARRSLTANELVIRRPLADNRREEIFVAKATLAAKYADLPPAQRATFAPLGLERPNQLGPTPTPVPEPPAGRAEVAPSVRPPPMPSRPPPRPSVPPTQEDVLSEAALAPPAIAGVAALGPRPNGDIENVELAKTLRRIFNAARSGRIEVAYNKLAELFSSATFAEYAPDEQREALKLLVHAKDPPKNDAALAANRAALEHLKRLAETLAEPADYEMLGLTHARLDDGAAADAAFERALELELARNGESALSRSLGRRLGRV